MAEIKTRIALRIDTYENWLKDEVGSNTGANLVLKRGEIGLCEIAANPADKVEATTVPTVLFKVGDGVTPFKTLKWASALAADVYDWAKKPVDEFMTWLDKTAGFATDAEVEAICAALAKSISELDQAYKAADSSLNDRLGDIEAALDLNNASSENSFSQRLANTEAAVETLNGDATKEGSVAHTVATAKADLITNTIGPVTEGKTVVEMISVAQDAAESHIDTAITELITKGQVATNTADIAELENAVADEKSARENADNTLSDRIDTVEGKLANVTNVMDFVGTGTATVAENGTITITVEGVDVFQKGDVVVAADGKEYVYDGTAWHEFGYADGNAAAISLLQGRMDTAEDAITDLNTATNTTLPAAIAEKVAIVDFNSYKNTVENTYEKKTVVAAIDDRLATAEGTITAQGQTIATKLDASTFNTFKTDTYDKDVAALQEEDENLNAAIGEIGGRVDTVEAEYIRYVANDDTTKPGKLVIGKTGEDIIIFNCGTSTEVI